NNISVYQLSIGSKSKINKLDRWNLESLLDWLQNKFSKLSSDSVIASRSLESIFYEDFADECKELKNGLKFATIKAPNCNEMLLVKDMKLSAFPHNLLLNEKKEFLSLKKPLTNVISREWFRNK